MKRFAGLATLAGLCVPLLAPSAVRAQPPLWLRLAPEAGWLSVEHSKRVAAGGGSSESATASSTLTLGASASVGVRTPLASGLFVGGELEGVYAGRRPIRGTIQPTASGEPHDVWPGEWDFRDRFGVGGNVLLGIEIRAGEVQGYVFGGIRRIWSEFATSGVDPETGETGERREQRGRWPSTLGVGFTLRRGWVVDVRIGYSRSLTEWTVAIPGILLDYGYAASGVTISAGIGLPR